MKEQIEKFVEDQKKLKALLLKMDCFPEGISACGNQHRQLHDSDPNKGSPTIWDSLIEGLTADCFAYRPAGKFESIAWCTWHITRIEDAIANILIADDRQVFDDEWKDRIGIGISDTANAFRESDVDRLDGSIRMHEMLSYRRAVGKKTQTIISGVKPFDIRKKPSESSLRRILDEGVLTEEKESFWLKEFWSKKTIGGLLLLPITRHQMMHIPECFSIKSYYSKKRPTTAST
jgi:hypothetical protein